MLWPFLSDTIFILDLKQKKKKEKKENWFQEDEATTSFK